MVDFVSNVLFGGYQEVQPSTLCFSFGALPIDTRVLDGGLPRAFPQSQVRTSSARETHRLGFGMDYLRSFLVCNVFACIFLHVLQVKNCIRECFKSLLASPNYPGKAHAQ